MSPEPPEPRARLAAQQAELLKSLLDASPPPSGFPPWIVALTGRGLLAKRLRSARHAWPVLADALGESLAAEFAAFAAAHPQAEGASALEDGLAFGEWLEGAGRFPPAAVAERLGVVLRYRRAGPRLLLRRGLALGVARQGRGQWLIALRLPDGREYWRRIRLPWRSA